MSGVNTMHKGWWVGENSEGRPSGSVIGVGQASLIILPGEAGAAVRASASLDSKNCLIHALARTYAHFFISILYVNFQFGSNEYILIVWHSSSLAAKLLRRVTRAKPDVYSY